MSTKRRGGPDRRATAPHSSYPFLASRKNEAAGCGGKKLLERAMDLEKDGAAGGSSARLAIAIWTEVRLSRFGYGNGKCFDLLGKYLDFCPGRRVQSPFLAGAGVADLDHSLIESVSRLSRVRC